MHEIGGVPPFAWSSLVDFRKAQGTWKKSVFINRDLGGVFILVGGTGIKSATYGLGEQRGFNRAATLS